MNALVEESEGRKRPIYVETTNETSVAIYERLGFQVVSRVEVPVVELPQWALVREPHP